MSLSLYLSILLNVFLPVSVHSAQVPLPVSICSAQYLSPCIRLFCSGADWPCLHLGNARWAGRVKVKKRSFLHGKKVISEFFNDFAQVGPVW